MIIISPSKNLNLTDENYILDISSPVFLSDSKLIISKIKNLNVNNLKSLMNISQPLAELNYQRFQEINTNDNSKKPAGFMFSGGTFTGLSIRSLNKSELMNAQKKLRILSGLYGMLKPFDLIEPYRLEMGTNMNKFLGEDLYDFWKIKLTNELNSEIKENKLKILYNLASKEYSSVIDTNKIECCVVNFDFKKNVDGNLVGIGMMIKKLRGAMSKFILTNKINNLDGLKNFNEYGFNYSGFDESNNQLIFVSK